MKFVGFFLMVLFSLPALADKYSDTVQMFKKAEQGGGIIDSAYGYAVFPTIGKGGIGIGGAYGEGRVYQRGQYIGNTRMAQVSVGWQFGGQAYSQLIAFKDKRALDEFISGNFEFGAQATAVALTAGASAEATSKGGSAGMSGGSHNAKNKAVWYKGMATYTIAKGGLMYEASIAGQAFEYAPK